MPRMGGRLLIALLFSLLMMGSAAAAVAYVILGERGEAVAVEPERFIQPGLFQAREYTVAMGPGSSLEASYSILVESKLAERTNEQERTVSIKVEGYEWPDAKLRYSVDGGEEKDGFLPFARLGLPLEMLGSETLGLPVYVPVADSTICVEASLDGVEEWNGRKVFVYSGEEVIGTAVIKVRAAYYRDDGLVAWYEIKLLDPTAGRVEYREETVTYTPSEAKVSGVWQCGGGVYSDIRYAPEGLIKIIDGKVYKASLDEVRRAVDGETIVFAVLSKSCPYCQKDWEHILKASMELPVPIYAINVGGLTPAEEMNWATVFANKLGIRGTPTFVAIKDGQVVDVLEGYSTWEEIVDWAREKLGLQG